MSSLLGVWQSVPYLFADLWGMLAGDTETPSKVETKSASYRGYLVFLGLVSIAGLFGSFIQIQKIYAILGALFIPLLTMALLALNGRADLMGQSHRDGWATRTVLIAILVMFLGFGVMELGAWR